MYLLTQLILLRNNPCVEQPSLSEVISNKQSVDRIKQPTEGHIAATLIIR